MTPEALSVAVTCAHVPNLISWGQLAFTAYAKSPPARRLPGASCNYAQRFLQQCCQHDL